MERKKMEKMENNMEKMERVEKIYVEEKMSWTIFTSVWWFLFQLAGFNM